MENNSFMSSDYMKIISNCNGKGSVKAVLLL